MKKTKCLWVAIQFENLASSLIFEKMIGLSQISQLQFDWLIQ
ncbi:hypothetical protein pb186bvf_001800 [Paramecium bursaria]